MTIEIPLGTSLYHVEIDGSNYTVTKDSGDLNEKTGKMPVAFIGYMTSIESAVLKIINDYLGTKEESVTLNEFLIELRSLKEEIENLLK